jgi:hypothetical protein
MMYMLGPILDDDEDFLEVVETKCTQVEQYQWLTKDCTATQTTPNKNSTDKNTNKDKDNKQDHKKDHNKDENKKEVKH